MNDFDRPAESAAHTQSSEIAEAMELYLELVESSGSVDSEAFVAKYPKIADELRACLESIQFLNAIGPDVRSSDVSELLDVERQLGDYRLIREVGRGGMGVVYEAEQISLDRRVALKVLPFASLLDGRQLERFRNEARAAASLKHPNIVSVHGVGSDRSVHYYTMDLIDGCDLAYVINRIHKDDGLPSPTENTQTIARLSTEHSGSRRDFFGR